MTYNGLEEACEIFSNKWCIRYTGMFRVKFKSDKRFIHQEVQNIHTSDMASKEDPFSNLNTLYIGLTLKYAPQTKFHLLAVRLFREWSILYIGKSHRNLAKTQLT
jgi:hypothetical protein